MQLLNKTIENFVGFVEFYKIYTAKNSVVCRVQEGVLEKKKSMQLLNKTIKNFVGFVEFYKTYRAKNNVVCRMQFLQNTTKPTNTCYIYVVTKVFARGDVVRSRKFILCSKGDTET